MNNSGDINEVSLAIGELKSTVGHLTEAVAKLNSHVESLNSAKSFSLGAMSAVSTVVSVIVMGIGYILKGH